MLGLFFCGYLCECATVCECVCFRRGCSLMILQILCTHAHNYVWTVARQRAKQHAYAPTIHRESQRSLTRTMEELVDCFVLALPQIVSAARIYLCKTSRKTLVTLPQSTLSCSLLLLRFVSHPFIDL